MVVDKNFKTVVEIFKSQLNHNRESGAAFAVYKNGKALIDIYGGYQKKNILWNKNTIVNVHSTGKGIVLMCISMLIDKGILNIDEYVSSYWPEFGKKNKQKIKVKHILQHQSGLYGWKKKMKVSDLLNSNYCNKLIANQETFHKPGEATCYHGMTIGYIINKIFENLTNMSVGKYIKNNLVSNSNINCFIGTPEKVFENISKTKKILSLNKKRLKNNDIYFKRAFQNPEVVINDTNKKKWIMAEIPALNCLSNASSLARLYDKFNKRGRIVSYKTFKKITKIENYSMDYVLRMPIKWSSIGYIIDGGKLFGNSKNSYGHTGSGGSLAFSDPDTNISVAYTPNFLSEDNLSDNRASILVEEVYKKI